MTLFGIDAEALISNWPGRAFAIFRCVREGGAVDFDYAANVKFAESHGAIPGGYHYIGHGRPIREDVRAFVDAMGDPKGRLVAADVEDAGLTWDEVQTWFDEYRRHVPTHPVLLYTYRSFWVKYMPGRNGAALSPYLWAANPVTGQYEGDASDGWRQDFGGWRDATIWQYAHSVNAGYGASTDLNAYRGTLLSLRTLAGLVTDRYRVVIRQKTPIYAKPDGTRLGFVSRATYTTTRSKVSGGQWWFHITGPSYSAHVGHWFPAEPWLEVTPL